MDDRPIHRAVSADGTEIAGRVHGQGPPLVLVHGGLGDGEASWRFLLPLLTDQLTCYAMSTRGRGLSADHPDHSVDALVGDVVGFAQSIGQPVAALGHSSSLVLAAAARTESIRAVAVHEPAVPALLGSEDPRPQAAIGRAIDAAGDGRHEEAVRTFFEDSGLFNDDEVARLVELDAYGRMASNVTAWARTEAEGGGAVDWTELERVDVPALLLQGSRTPVWFRDSVRDVAGRLADVRVREVAGAGHMGPLVAPDAVAAALLPFLTAAVTPPARRRRSDANAPTG